MGLVGLNFTQDRITLAIITIFNAMANIRMNSRAKDNNLYSSPYFTRVSVVMYLIEGVCFDQFYSFPSSIDL